MGWVLATMVPANFAELFFHVYAGEVSEHVILRLVIRTTDGTEAYESNSGEQ